MENILYFCTDSSEDIKNQTPEKLLTGTIIKELHKMALTHLDKASQGHFSLP